MTNIMQVYQNRIKEVILSGIGGISSNKGAAIGDVCINSISADYDLQYYGADQALTREVKPEFWSSDDPNPASRLYMDTALAEELYAASGRINPDFKVWGPRECHGNIRGFVLA